jgi:hypothetical protein
MVERLTDAIVTVDGENMREVTWVIPRQPPHRRVAVRTAAPAPPVPSLSPRTNEAYGKAAGNKCRISPADRRSTTRNSGEMFTRSNVTTSHTCCSVRTPSPPPTERRQRQTGLTALPDADLTPCGSSTTGEVDDHIYRGEN